MWMMDKTSCYFKVYLKIDSYHTQALGVTEYILFLGLDSCVIFIDIIIIIKWSDDEFLLIRGGAVSVAS